jgi:hypothetical protein
MCPEATAILRKPWNTWKDCRPRISESLPCAKRPDAKDSFRQVRSMLLFKERRPAIGPLSGWAISVLNGAGAIRECEEHGWMQDRADPHARDRAFDIVRRDPVPVGNQTRTYR